MVIIAVPYSVYMQSEDKTVLFAVGSTLVNCTNSYDMDKPDPQMVELAKYAKQHVPEEHPKVATAILHLADSLIQSDLHSLALHMMHVYSWIFIELIKFKYFSQW